MDVYEAFAGILRAGFEPFAERRVCWPFVGRFDDSLLAVSGAISGRFKIVVCWPLRAVYGPLRLRAVFWPFVGILRAGFEPFADRRVC
jgi:hypothetical protein